MGAETSPTEHLDERIYVAGHAGLVGSAIVRRLHAAGYDPDQILVAPRSELDLRDQAAVERWLARHRPTQIYLVAGTVGGIMANMTRPAEFIYDNLMIHATVVHAASRVGVDKLLYLGSSCIYPREAPQPITEEALLTGRLEPTNEAYAVAKIAGIKLCQAYRRQYGCRFIAAMPTNLYGPNDSFDLEASHVVPALMRKLHEARRDGRREVEIWGTGTPRRELLHVDDLADACLFLMRHYDDEPHVNIGTGQDISIRGLAELIAEIVHPDAVLRFDTSKPDGMPRKQLDVSRIHALGWHHRIGLRDGLESCYRWLVEHEHEVLGATGHGRPAAGAAHRDVGDGGSGEPRR